MDVEQTITSIRGWSSTGVNHFNSLNFVEIVYWQGESSYRPALFSLYLLKTDFCGVIPDGDVHLHTILASSLLLSRCILQEMKLPHEFNTANRTRYKHTVSYNTPI